MAKKTIAKKQLRSFGLILAVGFTIIAVAPWVFRGHSPRMWAVYVALVFGAGGLIYPPVLRPFFGVWMAIGEVLAWVNTRIILTLLYYLLVVPTGIIMRLAGKDPMRLKFERDAESYRIIRTKRDASHMLRQY